MSLCCFLSGTVYNDVTKVIGEVYAAELLLIPVALGVLFFGRTRAILTQRFLVLLIITCLIMLIGYIISDLYRGSDPTRYLRGWGRILLLISDMLVFAILSANHKRNIWWFLFGLGVGTIASLLIKGSPLSNWKFGYGEPIIYTVACLAVFLPMRIISVALAIVGLLSVALDSRIYGGISLLLSVFLWVRAGRPQQSIKGLWQYWKIGLVGIIAVIALGSIYTSTQTEYSVHREQSNLGRMIMLRVGLAAIVDSPFIGYGSWSESKRFAEMTNVEIAKAEGKSQLIVTNSESFGPHSQILQAWVEGGILAVPFFLMLGYRSYRAFKYVALSRPVDAYTPIFFYVLAIGLWNLVMSPFAGIHRIFIALSVAIFADIALEFREKNAKARTAVLRQQLSEEVKVR